MKYSRKNKKGDKRFDVNEPIGETYGGDQDLLYRKILEAASLLSSDKITILIEELNDLGKKAKGTTVTEFQKFLLKGPVMSDSQYREYQQAKEHFNKWNPK